MTVKDWFISLDENAKLVENYEKNIKKFYHNQLRYNSTFTTGFYKKEKFNPISAIKVVPSLVTTFIAILGIWIAIIVKSNEGDLLEAVKVNWKSALITSVIIGVILLVLIIGASIGLAIMNRKSLMKKMDAQEQELYNFIKTVPSNFRSSVKMGWLYQMYCARPDAPPDVIFQTGNETAMENRVLISSIMFDIPYKNHLLEGIKDGGAYVEDDYEDEVEEEKEEKKPVNPYLPPDIETKTFEGSSDSEKDLAEMIGLDSVKDQVKTIKQRVQFYGQASNGNHMQFLGGAGTGKAQPLYSKVLTPNGYITMGDVEIGTEVITAKGNIGKVSGIYPQGKRDIYEITLQDRTKIRVADNHLNSVWVYNQRTKQREDYVLETLDLIEFIKSSKWKVRVDTPSVDFEKQEVLINPYLLGALLGDGGLSNTYQKGTTLRGQLRFTNSEQDVLGKVNTILNDEYGMTLQHIANYDYRIKYIENPKHNGSKGDEGKYPLVYNYNKEETLRGQLEQYGLLCRATDKHIPQEYLLNTKEVRLQVLQGLFDTDGTIGNDGSTVTFSTSSKTLSDDFAFLVRSLGIRDTVSEKQGKYKKDGKVVLCNTSYQHYLSVPNDLVFCTSEKYRARRNNRQSPTLRNIISIEYVGKENCQCIMVDHEDHTYISDDFIPTHNTTIARIMTKILYDLKIIQKNQYVEISGDYLRSGDTNRASAIIDYAMGGVLFIDEAYLLYDKNGRGAEATGVLLKAMEDRRSDFVCILAGYEEQMTKLIASNEGFSSRIKHTIYFADYSVDEMLNIFNYFVGNYNGKKYVLANDAIDELKKTFELEKRSKSFGNARTVRNAVDTVMDAYADRCIATHNNTNTVTLDDVRVYAEKRKVALQHELKNASATNQLDENIVRQAELKSRLKAGAENPDSEIGNLIGAEAFKKEIDLLKSQKEFYGKTERQKVLLLGENDCNNYVRLLTGYLYQMGYITDNKYLDIQAEFLKGSYVGHTAKRAEAIIAYASGGVLLIRNLNMVNESKDSYGSEAISAIMTAITDNNDVTIVIADTPSQFISSIQSYFTITYELPVYTKDQLCQIFMMMAQKDGFSLDQSASDKLNVTITPNMKEQDVVGLYNEAKKAHITNYTEETKYILTGNDIVAKPKIKLNLKMSV